MSERVEALGSGARLAILVVFTVGSLLGCGGSGGGSRNSSVPETATVDRPGSSTASANAFLALSLELGLPFDSAETLAKRAGELGMKGSDELWTVRDGYGETVMNVPGGFSRNWVEVHLTFTPASRRAMNPGVIEALGRSFEISSFGDPDEIIFERVHKGSDDAKPGVVRNSELIAVGLPQGIWHRTMRTAYWTKPKPAKP